MRDQLDKLALQLTAYEPTLRVTDHQREMIAASMHSFKHTARRDVSAAGVSAGGLFPALGYRDVWIYVTNSRAVWYCSDTLSGLREINAAPTPTLEFTWLPENQHGNGALDQAFSAVSGVDVLAAIKASDYRYLKDAHGGTRHEPSALQRELLRPQAGDAGNLAIQFRAMAELGMALRLLRADHAPQFLLLAGTLSLPLVRRARVSLFYEHLKRLCCVEARKRGAALIAVSRSYRSSEVELVEEIVRTTMGAGAEHWYLRIPTRERDDWELPGKGDSLPPPGAVTYLVRFHRSHPVMRIDVDATFWEESLRGKTGEETREHERQLLETLDFLGHDQRSYGYPRPLTAAQQRATLSKSDSRALRGQIVDAGVRAGLQRSHFREVRAQMGEV